MFYALRIVKPPTGVGRSGIPYRKNELGCLQPGLFCADAVHAFRGVEPHKAFFYKFPLEAATALAMAEERHPGMAVEVVPFVEAQR